MVNVCLFAGRKAAINLCDDLIVHQLQENPSSSRIKHLLNSGTICFVFVPFLFGEFLELARPDLIIDLMQVDLGIQLGVGILMIGLHLAFALLILITTARLQSLLIEVLELVIRGIAAGILRGFLEALGLGVRIEVERILADFRVLVGMLKHTIIANIRIKWVVWMRRVI